jgi:hypothetical protein
MGLLRRLFSRKRPRRSEAQRALRYVWRSLSFGAEFGRPPRIELPDALLLQFGKVASTSLQAAIRAAGYNALHCHALSEEALAAEQSRLLLSPARARITGILFRRLVRLSATRLLLNWYRLHKTKDGRRLKIVTLTRDPVNWYRSASIQRLSTDPSPVLAWQAARSPSQAPQLETALAGLLQEVMTRVVALRPSADCPGAIAEARRILDQAGPDAQLVALETRRALGSLDWFDREIRHLCGFDLQAAPQFRTHGFAQFETDFAEGLVLRYEALQELLPQLAQFLGRSAIELPRMNITEGKPVAPEIERVFRDALQTPLGIAFARELRGTPYARACGYDG